MRLALVIIAALVVGGGTAAIPSLGATTTTTVLVKDDFFSPKKLTVSKGSTVKWRWSGKIPHNVTAGGFHSKTSNKLTFSHKFVKAGTFKVQCTIHQSFGQKMTIRVK